MVYRDMIAILATLTPSPECSVMVMQLHLCFAARVGWVACTARATCGKQV